MPFAKRQITSSCTQAPSCYPRAAAACAGRQLSPCLSSLVPLASDPSHRHLPVSVELPGDGIPGVSFKHACQIIAPPSDYLEVGEVCLPGPIHPRQGIGLRIGCRENRLGRAGEKLDGVAIDPIRSFWIDEGSSHESSATPHFPEAAPEEIDRQDPFPALLRQSITTHDEMSWRHS
jgi:hypothetical protein